MNLDKNMEQDKYNRRIEDIFSRHPSVQNTGFGAQSYKPGLSAMLDFDKRLGEPWKAYHCIHIAGTNGKGSVASFLASALESEGFRTGLFTSPHLLDFRERAKLLEGSSPEMISKEEVMDFLDRTDGFSAGLSFFEITTGMAFDFFKRRSADWAVIEVGLGGRLDSTNIINPEISIITSIGLDHCALLGDTREKIAFEKAGIFKCGVPALVWGHDRETDPVFERVASQVGAPLYFADELIPWPLPTDLLSRLDLSGEYQKGNLRTSLAALWILQERDLIAKEIRLCDGTSLSDTLSQALIHTAERTGLHGRWERVMTGPEVILDIAHNPPALKRNFKNLENSGKHLIIVFGIMADKDLDSISRLMPPDADYILCAPNTPRAMKVEVLHERLSLLRPDLHLSIAPSVQYAVNNALKNASNEDLVYIGGSSFVVAEAEKALL